MLPPRLILFHKQSTSGRTRFLKFATGFVAFEQIPFLSTLVDERDVDRTVCPHPAASLRDAERRLGLTDGAIEAETEFYAELDTPQGRIPILLAAFTTIDPPFAAAETLGGRFVPLTELFGSHPAEVDLVRRAYELILG